MGSTTPATFRVPMAVSTRPAFNASLSKRAATCPPAAPAAGASQDSGAAASRSLRAIVAAEPDGNRAVHEPVGQGRLDVCRQLARKQPGGPRVPADRTERDASQ